MNQDRLKQFISVMYRAKENGSINMEYYQDIVEGPLVMISEEEIHACGNRACALGYLALSHEWREAGGGVDDTGAPIFDGNSGSSALMLFLECTKDIAESIVHGDIIYDDIIYGDAIYHEFSTYYDKPWGLVVAQDVIDKLEGYLV